MAIQKHLRCPLLFELARAGGSVRMGNRYTDSFKSTVVDSLAYLYRLTPEERSAKHRKSHKFKWDTNVNYSFKKLEADGLVERHPYYDRQITARGLSTLQPFVVGCLQRLNCVELATVMSHRDERGRDLFMNVLRKALDAVADARRIVDSSNDFGSLFINLVRALSRDTFLDVSGQLGEHQDLLLRRHVDGFRGVVAC